MKDSLYVLGYYCEDLVRTGTYSFSKDEFLRKTLRYCKDMVIDIDCARLFAVLAEEHIIMERNRIFVFRYTSWIHFFCAHRMHHEKQFQEYILSDRRYINFPEMIEFYSGIDRRRNELITQLTDDLATLSRAFESRSKIDLDFDPYEGPAWTLSHTEMRTLESNIEREIESSNLPATVKDSILDRRYDRGQPYNQVIRNFANDSSLLECCLLLRGAARALRNSDFVEPRKKMRMLEEILRAWSKLFQLVALLSPIFAQKGSIEFENIRFHLIYENESTVEELFVGIMEMLPHNIVSYFESDLASARTKPLFEQFIKNRSSGCSQNNIGRCIVATILLRQRPQNWYHIVTEYAMSLKKESLYLRSLLTEALHEYRYGFCTHAQKQEIEDLIGVILARHRLGKKKPGKKLIRDFGKEFVTQNVE